MKKESSYKNPGNRGSISIPLALLACVTTIASLGLVLLTHDWSRQMKTQLRLDRCVAEAAIDLKVFLQQVSLLNTQIKATRALIAVSLATVAPSSQTLLLRSALRSFVITQEALRMKWKSKTILWRLQNGCGARSDQALALPRPQFHRLPEDLIGEQSLEIDPDTPRKLRIEAGHHPRASAAEIIFQGDSYDHPIARFAAKRTSPF